MTVKHSLKDKTPMLPTASCKLPGSERFRAECGESCTGVSGPDGGCHVIREPTRACASEGFADVNEVILRLAGQLNARPRPLAWPSARPYLFRGARTIIRDLRRKDGTLPPHRRAGYCAHSSPTKTAGVVHCGHLGRTFDYNDGCGARCAAFTPRYREELASAPDGSLPEVPAPAADERLASVREAMRRLPELQRRVLELHFGIDAEEHSAREIAAALDKSEGWVRRTLMTIYDRIRRQVE